MRIDLSAGEGNFNDLSDQVRTMIDEMASGTCFGSHAPRSWRPCLNMYELKDRYVICVELAGMDPSDIDVEADGEVLRIRGTRARPTVPDPPGEVSVHLMEIDSGAFSRKVPLPGDIDPDRVSASYRHGYLWIELPRRRAGGADDS